MLFKWNGTPPQVANVRSVLPQAPVMSYTATTVTSFSVNCNGAERAIVHVGAITASITLTLHNLRVGIPVQIVVSNSCHQRSRVLLEALQTLPP